MPIKFVARGVSDKFKTAEELLREDCVVPLPVSGGTVTLVSDSGGKPVFGTDALPGTDSPYWSYTLPDGNREEEGDSIWYVADDTLQSFNLYSKIMVGLGIVEQSGVPVSCDSGDGELVDIVDGVIDKELMIALFNQYPTKTYPEKVNVWDRETSERGICYKGSEGDFAVIRDLINIDGLYYSTEAEMLDKWQYEEPDEAILYAYFGSNVDIPEGYHVVDVKTSTAYLFDNIKHTLTYGVNNYSTSNSNYNYLQIGRIGDLGYSINLIDSDVENAFGNQPCLQLFRVTTATDSSSLKGFYFTYRSTQTPSSYGTSADVSINSYYDTQGFGIYSGFLWFDRMLWSSYPSSIESNYLPWQLRYYNASNTQEYYKFFLQRSLWSVNNNTLTWLGDITNNQDLAFYYYGSGYTRMQIIISKKNKLPEAICFSRSGDYQFQDYTVNSGNSSYLYEKFKGDTLTDYSTDYEIVKIYNSNGVEVSKEGVSISTDQAKLRVQNNSGSALTFNNIVYRKVITDYVTVSLYLRGTGIDNSLLAKTFTAGDYWWSCLKDQYGVSSVQALGCSVFSGDPFDTGFGMIEYDPVHYYYSIVGLYTDRESSSSATTSLSNFSISYRTSQNFTVSAGKYAVVIQSSVAFNTSCKSWRLRIKRKSSYAEGEKLAFLNTTKLPKSYASYNAWSSGTSSNDETLIQNGILHYGHTGYTTYKYSLYDENGDPISYNENICYKVVGLVRSDGSGYARDIFSFYYGTSYIYNSTRSYAYPLINDSGNLIFAPFDAGYYGTSYELSSTIVAIVYEEVERYKVFSRSSSHQDIDSKDLPSGSSSVLYEEGKDVSLDADPSILYEIVQILSASGTTLSYSGITLENISGKVCIVNQSGTSIKWNRLFYITKPAGRNIPPVYTEEDFPRIE